MTDYSELKRLAEAAKAKGADLSDMNINTERMYEAGYALIKLYEVATPAAVLALIAENERLKVEIFEDEMHFRVFGQALEDVIAERDQLKAEKEALRLEAARAAYWKQRAKSAEGHLFSSDVLAGGRALHQWVRMSDKPWNELSNAERNQLFHAAFRVIAAVNGERDRRKPGNDVGVTYAEEDNHG